MPYRVLRDFTDPVKRIRVRRGTEWDGGPPKHVARLLRGRRIEPVETATREAPERAVSRISHVGGGWYTIERGGTRYRGREAAEEAAKEQS